MRRTISILIVLSVFRIPVFSETEDPRLARFLEKFPDADHDGNGTQTMAEAESYRQKMRGGDDEKRDARSERKP